MTELMLLESHFRRYVSFMSIKIIWPCLLTPLPPWLGGGVISDLTIKGGEGGFAPPPPPTPKGRRSPLKKEKETYYVLPFVLQSKILDVMWARTPTILFRIT